MVSSYAFGRTVLQSNTMEFLPFAVVLTFGIFASQGSLFKTPIDLFDFKGWSLNIFC